MAFVNGKPPEAYDHMKIDALTVRQVANIVANENHDVTPGMSSAKDLQQAKLFQAHAIINADQMYGPDRMAHVKTASKEVTPQLENSAQYKQALDVARTAFQEQLAGEDPTGGRMYFNNRSDAGIYPRHFKYGDAAVFKQYARLSLVTKLATQLLMTTQNRDRAHQRNNGLIYRGGFLAKIFFTDSMHAACMNPDRSGSRGQTS